MTRERIAVINVGSHSLNMKIGEILNTGEFRELENVNKYISIGNDTFTTNKIAFETVDKVCDTLLQFKNLMNDYRVVHYRAVATSAVREAENKSYLLDQIKLKTDFNVNVISNAEEQTLIYVAIRKKLNDFSELIKEGAVFLVIGAGSIQVLVYKNSQLISSQNVKLGALRLKDTLSSLENEILSFHKLLEEYIEVKIEALDFNNYIQDINNYIAVGSELPIIFKIIQGDEANSGISSINKSDFNIFYNDFIENSRLYLDEKSPIDIEKRQLILPSIVLFKIFLEKISVNKIIAPKISLAEAIVIKLIEEINASEGMKKYINEDMYTSVKILAEKYNYNEKHCIDVCEKSLLIFDSLQQVHGLKKERILLKIASILHNIGKYINFEEQYIHSYNIIKSTEFIGLSNEDIEIIASITRFYEQDTPLNEHICNLTETLQIIVAKLAAILRIADALDRSHHQKINLIRVECIDKEVVIYGETMKDIVFENWAFSKKVDFFKEVFGLTPVLKMKKLEYSLKKRR